MKILRPFKRARGFTLPELLATLGITGILVAAAAPSFAHYLSMQKVRNASFDLVATMMFARSEAIKRNASINIVAKDGEWAKGWSVEQDDGTELRNYEPHEGVEISALDSLKEITFTNDGRSSNANARITLTKDGLQDVNARCISVDLSGMATAKQGAC